MSCPGDVQNVFNNGGPKGAAAGAIVAAIANEGRTLDCYDGFLPSYYRQFGFEETGRMKFNPEFAPANWDPKLGAPDIVFMAWKGYPEGGAKGAIERAGSRKDWIKNVQSTNYSHLPESKADKRSTWEIAKAVSRLAAKT